MHRSHWHPAEENGYAFDLIFRQFIIVVLPWSLISHTYFERAVACGLSLFFRADLSWPYLVLNLFFCHTYVCFDFHVWDLHTSFINNWLHFTVSWDWAFIFVPTFAHLFICCCFFFFQYFRIVLTYMWLYICTSAVRNFDFCTVYVLMEAVVFWKMLFH